MCYVITGNYRDPSTGSQMDEKSNQWFGATVRSAGPNSSLILVICLQILPGFYSEYLI